ncbi:peptide-methionine (R)-S-oxide reductase MsrB [Gemmatimonas sp.]|uniref:peptide-methionine (R)-S-oxide reductase MsrB n=1 Tax=Gemmatimonas sp. TaxID=1962908 RepID=UPI003568CB61
MADKIRKSELEWRTILSTEQFRVLRSYGTERAFAGCYWDHHDDGQYICAGCGQPLFSSSAKFDSGTGWPSFTEPLTDVAIETSTDRRWFIVSVEVHCASCDGHLGHVFDDGPTPGGMRYRINSASLDFSACDD